MFVLLVMRCVVPRLYFLVFLREEKRKGGESEKRESEEEEEKKREKERERERDLCVRNLNSFLTKKIGRDRVIFYF